MGSRTPPFSLAKYDADVRLANLKLFSLRCQVAIGIAGVLLSFALHAMSDLQTLPDLCLASSCFLILRLLLFAPTALGVFATRERHPLVARLFVLADGVGGGLMFIAYPASYLADMLGERSSIFFILPVILFTCLLPAIGLAVAWRVLGVALAGIRAPALCGALQARGYDWMTPALALELWQLCGERAFRLAQWEFVGVLPDVAEGDLEALNTLLVLQRRPGRWRQILARNGRMENPAAPACE